jgi:hypothetical protein
MVYVVSLAVSSLQLNLLLSSVEVVVWQGVSFVPLNRIPTRKETRQCHGECATLTCHMLQIRESPGLPSAGSCMFVLAQLARTPPGRAQVRAEAGITPVLR